MNRIIFCCLMLAHSLSAQFQVTGIVIDSSNNEPLPFVNIIFNNNAQLGTTTDIDGRFNFECNDSILFLQLSYIGYEAKKISISTSKEVLLKLQKTDLSIEEIVVIAGENPAYRIIRQASKNRLSHDPDRIPKFSYSSYNKLLVYDQLNSPTPVESVPEKDRYNFYYSLIEILSEVQYIAPDKREENIIASKVSGFKEPSFVTAMAEIQPTDFHKENILILDKEYLNPLSNGCITQYEYRIEDTLYQDKDSVFVIRFFPRKGKNFDALKGMLYLNTNGYAIQNVIAEPAQKQKINLRIQQQYSFIDNQKWFPTQLNFEIELAPAKKDTFTVQGKRYITNINLNPDIKAKDFGLNKVRVEEDAYEKDSLFWLEHRTQPLSIKEKETYRFLDKAFKALPLDFVMGALNELGDDRIQLGDLSVNYTQIMEFNLHEQFRLGLGLYTSYKMSPYFSFGGYFAHGFKDKTWKYGGSLNIRPIPQKDLGFEISYVDDIIEPAAINLTTHSLSKKLLPKQSFVRRNVLDQMDKTYELEISGFFRIFRHLRTRLFGNWSHKIPLYAYRFVTETESAQQFKFVSLGIQLRFAYKEDFVQLGNSNWNIRSKFPIVYFSYTKGVKDLLGGEYNYDKIIAGVESSFFVKNFGRTTIFAQGGWIGGETPYPILFNGLGSFDRWRMFMVKNSFQTMRPNEFLANKFAYLFLEHNFGSLLLNTKNFKPEVKIYQAIGFGWLDNPQQHQDINIQDMSKGYFESGIMLSNLLRLNMLNFGYFGVGAGIFVRYGAYFLPTNVIDNIAIKIDMSVTF